MPHDLVTAPTGQYEFDINEFQKGKTLSFDQQLLLQKADLYTNVHKGLRALMFDTLVKLGQLDRNDDDEFAQTLDQLQDLITVSEYHLEVEERFIHRAMATRSPGSEQTTHRDHNTHRIAIERLRNDTLTLEHAPVIQRATLVTRIYQQLALFIADNLVHMHEEETENASVLCRFFATEELAAIHREIISSIPPMNVSMFLKWIVPSLPANERSIMLQGIKRDAPREAFAALINNIETRLSARNVTKLRAENII